MAERANIMCTSSVASGKYVTWSIDRIRDFQPTAVANFAFLTPDRLELLGAELYARQNRELTNQFLTTLEIPSVRSAITVSSGAALYSAYEPYGELKLEEERAALALAGSARSVVVARVYSVSGPFVREPRRYAFSDMIIQASEGRVVVDAERPTYRRYVRVADVLRVCRELGAQGHSGVVESGGELIEMGELASEIVAGVGLGHALGWEWPLLRWPHRSRKHTHGCALRDRRHRETCRALAICLAIRFSRGVGEAELSADIATRSGSLEARRAALVLAGFSTWIYIVRALVLVQEGRFAAAVPAVNGSPSWSGVASALVVLVIGCIGLLVGFSLTLSLIRERPKNHHSQPIRIAGGWAILVVGLMTLLSVGMLLIGVGVTTYFPPEPLPLKLTGILIYGRLLILPLVMCILAAISSGRWRWILLMAIVVECVIASAASGSRIIALLHSLPLLFLALPWLVRVGSSVGLLFVGLNVATRSRSLVVPFAIDDPTLHKVYANSAAVADSMDLRNALALPWHYIVDRTLGLPELMMVSDRSGLCSSVGQALRQTFFALTPFVSGEASCTSLQDVYQVPNGVFGGLNLDFFGGIWFMTG
ncbi:MAG: hypothetical protein NTX29_05255, partial [Actinobacteria bacterium]|nr:hypothetical protein [Actinomycetota bacterium]